ncbi:MAG: aminotransferase class I/II-fold pyridoxal phosphate-dependent enzyme [Kofleriaceae bacterium]|nr:aminotransferase class I/II-fold pyridoxal phosphate-dependent enzyme [Kofleriaceae bacterium]
MSTPIAPWLDPATCPAERPPLGQMGTATRDLHAALDAHARAAGVAWLHPEHPTLQRDLLGSPAVVAWQQAKADFMLAGEGAWSELPHLYARYGTPGTTRLITALRGLEQARCAVVTDSGMQALALVADVLITSGAHGIVMRQIYNKTRTFFEWSAKRAGATITLVDDGDLDALRVTLTSATRFVLAETFTNPLMRAQDVPALRAIIAASPAPAAHLVIDGTIATPWAFRRTLLAQGASIVTGSLTKALGGQDAALGGYVATDDTEVGNAIMDLLAMRGGILDDARAHRIADGLAAAEHAHARRCASATRVAAFLAAHPAIERVFHPSQPDHPDAAVIAREYTRPGSIVSFRVAGADERAHRHIADVLVSCGVLRYALSFDGLATKVNHHRTVSEFFTPADVVARLGIDRLIRLGIGLEDPDDLTACLNWTLHNHARVTTAELEAWRTARAAELGLR